MLHDIKDYHIFSASLYTVSENAELDPSKSKIQNLQKAILYGDLKKVKQLYVKKTIYRNLYQEIITQKMIPAYREISFSSLFNIKKGPNASAFLIVPEKINYNGRRILLTHLTRYENYKINNYFNKHSDEAVFAQELDDIFYQAEQNYQRILK